MSYILDALRRAEADRERERGQVPGLHTPAPSGSEPAPARLRWLPWAGGGLLLLAGIGAGSWLTGNPREAVVPATAPAPATGPAPAPVAMPAPAPAMPAAVSKPPPPPAASASPYLPPAPPPGVVAATPEPPPPAPAVEAPVPRLSELPESLRRELPKLAISGSVYSDDPASRFVMVNGEVVREGARLGADLVLEKIGPRELVLRFKGQRFRQPV
jgi:general secretion pathway protein B